MTILKKSLVIGSIVSCAFAIQTQASHTTKKNQAAHHHVAHKNSGFEYIAGSSKEFSFDKATSALTIKLKSATEFQDRATNAVMKSAQDIDFDKKDDLTTVLVALKQGSVIDYAYFTPKGKKFEHTKEGVVLFLPAEHEIIPMLESGKVDEVDFAIIGYGKKQEHVDEKGHRPSGDNFAIQAKEVTLKKKKGEHFELVFSMPTIHALTLDTMKGSLAANDTRKLSMAAFAKLWNPKAKSTKAEPSFFHRPPTTVVFADTAHGEKSNMVFNISHPHVAKGKMIFRATLTHINGKPANTGNLTCSNVLKNVFVFVDEDPGSGGGGFHPPS